MGDARGYLDHELGRCIRYIQVWGYEIYRCRPNSMGTSPHRPKRASPASPGMTFRTSIPRLPIPPDNDEERDTAKYRYVV